MYNDYFGLSQAPFRITPDTRLFYTGGGRGEVLEALVYAITSGEGIIKVTGEVGTGKTMLCRMLENQLPEQVDLVYLANPSLSPDDIVQAVALELGIEPGGGGGRIEMVFQLQQVLVHRHARGRRVVVLIEEAQSMPTETLEEVRLLSNLETNQEKLLQIVLFGQPELDEKLASPEIRQLRERITHSFQLQPLAAEEIRGYVNFRLRESGYRGRDAFNADAFKAMGRASEGLVRRVNILADKALLAAFAEDTHDVERRHVDVAIRDSAFSRRRRRRAFSLAAVVLVGTAACAIGWFGASWLVGGASPEAPSFAASEAVESPPASDPGDGFRSAISPVSAAESAPPAPTTGSAGLTAAMATPAPAMPAESAPPANAVARAAARPADVPPLAVADAPAGEPVALLPAAQEEAGSEEPEEVVSPADPAGLVVDPGTPAAPSTPRPPSVTDTSPGREAPAEGPADGGTPAPLVRTLIAALSSGDGDMLAPPPAEVVAMSASDVVTAPMPGSVPAAGPPTAPGPVAATEAAPDATPGPAPTPALASTPAAAAPVETASPGTEGGASTRPPGADAVPVDGDLLDQRLRVTQTWLRGRDPDHYTIQVLATVARERRSLLGFLARQSKRSGLDDVYVYETSIGGRPWFSVVYGTFSNYSEARAALKTLPQEFIRHRPFIRNLSDLSARG